MPNPDGTPTLQELLALAGGGGGGGTAVKTPSVNDHEVWIPQADGSQKYYIINSTGTIVGENPLLDKPAPAGGFNPLSQNASDYPSQNWQADGPRGGIYTDASGHAWYAGNFYPSLSSALAVAREEQGLNPATPKSSYQGPSIAGMIFNPQTGQYEQAIDPRTGLPFPGSSGPTTSAGGFVGGGGGTPSFGGGGGGGSAASSELLALAGRAAANANQPKQHFMANGLSYVFDPVTGTTTLDTTVAPADPNAPLTPLEQAQLDLARAQAANAQQSLAQSGSQFAQDLALRQQIAAANAANQSGGLAENKDEFAQRLAFDEAQAAQSKQQNDLQTRLNAAHAFASDIGGYDVNGVRALLAAGGGNIMNGLSSGATALTPAANAPAAMDLQVAHDAGFSGGPGDLSPYSAVGGTLPAAAGGAGLVPPPPPVAFGSTGGGGPVGAYATGGGIPSDTGNPYAGLGSPPDAGAGGAAPAPAPLLPVGNIAAQPAQTTPYPVGNIAATPLPADAPPLSSTSPAPPAPPPQQSPSLNWPQWQAAGRAASQANIPAVQTAAELEATKPWQIYASALGVPSSVHPTIADRPAHGVLPTVMDPISGTKTAAPQPGSIWYDQDGFINWVDDTGNVRTDNPPGQQDGNAGMGPSTAPTEGWAKPDNLAALAAQVSHGVAPIMTYPGQRIGPTPSQTPGYSYGAQGMPWSQGYAGTYAHGAGAVSPSVGWAAQGYNHGYMDVPAAAMHQGVFNPYATGGGGVTGENLVPVLRGGQEGFSSPLVKQNPSGAWGSGQGESGTAGQFSITGKGEGGRNILGMGPIPGFAGPGTTGPQSSANAPPPGPHAAAPSLAGAQDVVLPQGAAPAGRFVGQTITVAGRQYVWNGSQFVQQAQRPAAAVPHLAAGGPIPPAAGWGMVGDRTGNPRDEELVYAPQGAQVFNQQQISQNPYLAMILRSAQAGAQRPPMAARPGMVPSGPGAAMGAGGFSPPGLAPRPMFRDVPHFDTGGSIDPTSTGSTGGTNYTNPYASSWSSNPHSGSGGSTNGQTSPYPVGNIAAQPAPPYGAVPSTGGPGTTTPGTGSGLGTYTPGPDGMPVGNITAEPAPAQASPYPVGNITAEPTGGTSGGGSTPPPPAPTPYAPPTPPSPTTQAPSPTTTAPGTVTNYLDQVQQFRQHSQDFGLNPYDQSFWGLTPWEQQAQAQSFQTKYGVPADLYLQQAQQYQLLGPKHNPTYGTYLDQGY